MWNIFVLAGALALIGTLTVYFINARREFAKLPPLKPKQDTSQKKSQKRDKKQPKIRHADASDTPGGESSPPDAPDPS